jgi:hypothetical protein
MTRRAVAILAAVALAAAAAAGPAEAQKRHPNCLPKGSHGHASSNRLRIYSTPMRLVRGHWNYGAGYACDLRTGSRRKLWRNDFGVGSGAEQARFAGTAAAFVEHRNVKQSSFMGVTSVEVVSGLKLRWPLGGGFTVSDLAVAPSGSAAFIERGSTTAVHRMTAGGHEVLEHGDAVERGSLGLSSGSRLYWTSGGAPRAAELDAEPQRFPAPTAAGGSRRCYPRGSVTIAASGWARVYRIGTSELGDRFVACHLRTGRRVVFDDITDAESHGTDAVRFAEPFVAVAIHGCIKVDCGGKRVQTINLATGAVRTVLAGEGGDWTVTDLEVRRNGAVAWIAAYQGKPSNLTELDACGPDSCRRLDSGAGVEPGSLAQATLDHLYCTGLAGLPRSATFGP